MGRIAVRLERDGREWFLEWSTSVDAPITMGMSREEFAGWQREEYGRQGERDWPERLERLLAHGTSACDRVYWNARVFTQPNRAGHGESCLSWDELIEWYCVRQEEPPPGVGVPQSQLVEDDE